MILVGLTGGIASGKSAVADRLAQLGAVIIDSDVLAREVVQPGTPGLAAIVERFGADVLDADGSLDRAKLGSIVFGDSEARRDLETIVHPAVRARATELTQAAPQDAVVVQVIPLLVEVGMQAGFERVIVVDVDPELQIERLIRRNGLTRDDAQARIDAQSSREQRLAQATDVITNNGTLSDLHAAVDEVWSRLVAEAAESS